MSALFTPAISLAVAMNSNPNGHQRPDHHQEEDSPEASMPLPITNTPEVLAEALFSLQQRHT